MPTAMFQVWRPASPSRPSSLAEVLSGCWVMFVPLLASGRAKCWRRQQAAKGWEQRKIYALPGHEAAGSHIVQLNVLLKGHGSKSKQSVKLIFFFLITFRVLSKTIPCQQFQESPCPALPLLFWSMDALDAHQAGMQCYLAPAGWMPAIPPSVWLVSSLLAWQSTATAQ